MRPLGICRTTFYVSKMVMCAVLVVFSLRGRAQSSVMMEKEACAFLQSLLYCLLHKKKLQEKDNKDQLTGYMPSKRLTTVLSLQSLS